jgi:uncharacterized protein with ParB-like and HNH nuclease domain
MNPTKRPLAEILGTQRSQHVIPFFQRKYEWKDDTQILPFLDFIHSIAENGLGSETNFIGFMVTDPDNQQATGLSCLKFNVIDGQQRLTTFSLILIALRKLAKEQVDKLTIEISKLKTPEEITIYEEYINQLKELSNDIKFKYLENKHFAKSTLEDSRLKFLPQTEDRENYKLAFEDNMINLKKETRLSGGFLTIVKDLRSRLCKGSPEGIYTNLLTFLAAAEDLEVVQLELEQEDDPQQIFETINDRGLRLSTVDIIKNRIFTESDSITEDEAKRWYYNYWMKTVDRVMNIDEYSKNGNEFLQSFIRTILIRNGTYITKNGLSAYFKDEYESKEKRIEFLEAFENLALPYLAICEKDTDEIKNKIISNTELIKQLIRLKKLDFQAPAPFILKLFENKITENDISNVIGLFERFFVRRSICGQSVKDLPKIFIKLCHEYEVNFIQGSNLTVYEWLVTQFKNDLVLSLDKRKYNYPTNNELRNNLLTKNIYQEHRAITLHILLRTNEFLMGKEYPGEIDGLQIEHVMPQKLSEQWIDYLGSDKNAVNGMHAKYIGVIGNLALTKLNPEMGNKLFSDKKEHLQKSSYSLTRDLANLNSWKEEDINKRTNDMIVHVINVFPDLP